MEYDRGDSFPFDFEPNGIPFGPKSKGNLSPRSYPIQFERKWNTSFQSAAIRRRAARKIGVCRHHEGPMEEPSEIPQTITALSY